MESEERVEWEEEESAGHPVGGFARPGRFYLIGSATMLESTGGARAGEFLMRLVRSSEGFCRWLVFLWIF